MSTTACGHEKVQILSTVGGHAKDESSMLGGGKTNTDVLLKCGNCGFKIISDKIIRAKIDTDLICTDRTFKCSPLAVAWVAIVLLDASAIVETRIRLAFAHTTFWNAIVTCVPQSEVNMRKIHNTILPLRAYFPSSTGSPLITRARKHPRKPSRYSVVAPTTK